MDSATDHFMVVEKKYGDFSFFAHETSVTYRPIRRSGRIP